MYKKYLTGNRFTEYSRTGNLTGGHGKTYTSTATTVPFA
jgi:hypothetical protein